jgi:hypothetical protein
MGNSLSNNEAIDNDDHTILSELNLLLVTLELVSSHLDDQETWVQQLLDKLRKEEKQEVYRQNRTREVEKPKRKTFMDITQRLSERQFQRTFRMQRKSFYKLSAMISNTIGDDEFKSETTTTRESTKTRSATDFHGGDISGELRLGIFLRMLAGSSYLDLFMIFGVSNSSIYNCFEQATDWINKTLTFRLVEALQKEDLGYLKQLSHAFSHDSNGRYNGCIGALDGLAIKIRRPTLSEWLKDAGAYFTRKGFFALNCQAICDVKKRILWISSRHIGSCHDSRAFKDTKLYELLLEKQEFLIKHELFLVGDSAYNLESFLLVPHEEPSPRSPEDAYNYYHSNCRIRIECCFGELIMRYIHTNNCI